MSHPVKVVEAMEVCIAMAVSKKRSTAVKSAALLASGAVFVRDNVGKASQQILDSRPVIPSTNFKCQAKVYRVCSSATAQNSTYRPSCREDERDLCSQQTVSAQGCRPVYRS